jgi:N utilization substance protein A
MLRRLLEMEVPEIHQGLVEIKAIAREAGKRAKVAVAALREGVDPVGACVGLRGVRIQSVVRDLNDEKIDVIEWNPDPATFIAKALSPARVAGVYLDEDLANGKTAMVVVPEDQLSLAIGRAGVNARLGAKLTGWRIDIKSLPESAVDSLALLTSEPTFADIAEREAEVVPEIESVLTKKAENRPVTPEEYQTMRDFVDRVQQEVMSRREAIRQREQEILDTIRATIPATAYDVAVGDIGFSTRVLNLLTQAEYQTAGQVMEQLELDEDKILSLPGIGPKAIQELREKLTAYEYPEVEVEAIVEEVVPVVEEDVEEVPEVEEVMEPELPEVSIEEPEEVEIEEEEELEIAEAPEVLEPMATVEEVFDTVVEELDTIVTAVEVEGDEEDLFLTDDERRKKRKRVSRVVEYDPDTGEMIVKRRRKREEDEWEDLDY